MKYIYEAHFHTSDVSGCANISAQEAVELYKNAGYSGLFQIFDLLIFRHFVHTF